MDREAQALATLRQYTLDGLEDTGRELGRGSYAVVLEINYHGLRCAGKKLYLVLYEQRLGDTIRRFAEECRLLSRLRHPNIVQFLGVYFESGATVPVLVMEYHPMTLCQRIDRNSELGILPDEIVYSVAADVALGLNYLHSQTSPVIHRDLSANNVLLSKDMTAKISDLGVAKILHLNRLELSKMTMTPGNPSYMPPEALEDNPQYDTSVDVFSYGVLLIHIFSGKWPHPTKAVTVDPNDPKKLVPVSEAERRRQYLDEISDDHPLMDLILRCLSNDPTSRPPAAEILQKVKEIEARYAPGSKEELLLRIKALSVSLEEAEERMKQKELMQRLSDRLDAAKKAAEELDAAQESVRALSENVNQCLRHIKDGGSQVDASVDELSAHFKPSEGGLCVQGALVSMESLCSSLEQAREVTEENTTRVSAAQQAVSAYITGLEQIKEKAREKAVKNEEVQESVQARIADLQHLEPKEQRRVDKLQETLSKVQEFCEGLEHVIQLKETPSADIDTINEQLGELQLTRDKVDKLLVEVL